MGGHHAAVIDAQGQVLACAAIDAPAAGVLGLLDGDSALRLRDQDGGADDEDERRHEEQDLADAQWLGGIRRGGESRNRPVVHHRHDDRRHRQLLQRLRHGFQGAAAIRQKRRLAQFEKSLARQS